MTKGKRSVIEQVADSIPGLVSDAPYPMFPMITGSLRHLLCMMMIHLQLQHVIYRYLDLVITWVLGSMVHSHTCVKILIGTPLKFYSQFEGSC